MTNLSKDGSTIRKTTTDATATTLASFAVDEAQSIMVVADVVGSKSDYSAGAWREVRYGARRASGGNITAIGSQQNTTLQEDSGGTPAISLDVDTTTQSVRIRVTGISAETWYWKATYKVTYL